MLFWMVVILGYRRQRNFERVFFFLCLALFFFYAGSLLALNAQIYYSVPPQNLTAFAAVLVGAGLALLPPLLFHLHWEFAATRGFRARASVKGSTIGIAYVPFVYFIGVALPSRLREHDFDFGIPGNSLGSGFVVWFALLLILSCGWERRFSREMAGRPERTFHRIAWAALVGAVLFLAAIHFEAFGFSHHLRESLVTAVSILGLLPFVALIYFVQRHNFLNIGRQKNLLYAVSATFVALLYLALVRRISDWMAPVLPPEATAAILLFALVVFIEPLQRLLSQRLQETARREMDLVNRLGNQIQAEARKGELKNLVLYINRRLAEELQFAEAWITMLEPKIEPTQPLAIKPEAIESFAVLRPGRINAVLNVRPHGSMISGETEVAMKFLCESMAVALDLCQVIDEKMQLERDLAERERLALVGQTAASISHNLKNPLGSIKTILQVQLESPEMPESMRGETKMVLEEISRLSAKLNQLLQFSRPAVRAGNGALQCDASAVIEEAAAVLKPQADKRNVELQIGLSAAQTPLAIAPEALHDIVSNLLVNALEAVPAGGHIAVTYEESAKTAVLRLEDDGPGIPESLQEKILQPFFTTKTQGTGLGLAIVARRVAECDGNLTWQSPTMNGRGTRFEITLPLVLEAS